MKRLLQAILTSILLTLISLPVYAQTFFYYRYQEAASDCTALTGGKKYDVCYDIDDRQLYKCVPSSGDCDTSGEWKSLGYLSPSGGTVTGNVTITGTLTTGSGTGQLGSSTGVQIDPAYDGVTFSGNSIFTADNKLGIGTTAPTTELHVVGGARISSLTNCDTIDTDANGVMSCGTDGGGSGSGTLQDAYDSDANGSDATIALTTADDSIVINNPSSSGTDSSFALRLDQNAIGVVALDIDTEATTANGIDLQPTVMTTGTALDIGDADALTTGKIANFVSNSGDTSTRTLIQITNDNSAAVGTTALKIQQDAGALALAISGNMAMGNGVYSASKIINIDTDLSTPNIEITGHHDSTRPVYTIRRSRGTFASPTTLATSDAIGTINFAGYDGSTYLNYAAIQAQNDTTPISTGVMGQGIVIQTGSTSKTATAWFAPDQNTTLGSSGTPVSRLTLVQNSGPVLTISRTDTTATAGDSLGAVNWHNTDSNLTTQNVFLSVEGVVTNTVTGDTALGELHVKATPNTAGSSPTDVVVIKGDGGRIDHTISGTTTNTGFNVTGDSLTTGALASFTSNASSTATRSLVSITNDNSAAVGTTALKIQQDANATALLVTNGLVDYASAGLKLPSSTTLPATCTTGQIYMDTDATTGQRIYACESTDTWALQGGSGGSSAKWIFVINPQEAKLPTSNPMTIEPANNRWAGLFDADTAKSAQWETMAVPYAGGAINGKVCYSMTSATSGTVEFDVDIMCNSPGDAADIDTDSFGTTNVFTETVPGTAGYESCITVTTLNQDSCAQYDHVVVKVSRDATDGTNDTATGNAELRKVLIYEN